MVAQDSHLFQSTIRDNLLYAKPNATDQELISVLRQVNLWDVIASLPESRLDVVVGDRGYCLSGGERQRFAIARILLRDPDIIVLDEATAHLDSESEAALQSAIEKALHTRTIIVIAHRLSTIVNAHQILVLNEGRIVQRGTHAELIRQHGLYRELYDHQFTSAGRSL